jgi:uncharacterized repeat protein (TIGR01451 family)
MFTIRGTQAQRVKLLHGFKKIFQVASLLLLSSLLASASGATSAPLQGKEILEKSARQPNAEVKYYINWSVNASGSGSRVEEGGYPWTITKFTAREDISIQGSAQVTTTTPMGAIFTAPYFILTVHHNYEWKWNFSNAWGSGHSEQQITLTDPGRYAGGPDYIYLNIGQFPGDTRDQLEVLGFFTNLDTYMKGNSVRFFTYRKKDSDGLGGSSSSTYEDDVWFRAIGYCIPSIPYTIPPDDPAGFSYHYSGSCTYPALALPGTGKDQMVINLNLQVTRDCASAAAFSHQPVADVCGCESQPVWSVIDDTGNNSIIDRLDVGQIQLRDNKVDPEAEIPLSFLATCAGRRVSNTELAVWSKAIPKTGAHEHHDRSRPNGYINGIEIPYDDPNTRDSCGIPKHAVRLKTNKYGVLNFNFAAGKDLVSHVRGISGNYKVNVQSTRFCNTRSGPGQANSHGWAIVDAGVDGLEIMPTSADSWKFIPFTNHKESDWVTESANIDFTYFVQDFRQKVSDHNQKYKSKWPMPMINILAISLKKGGLFDIFSDWGFPLWWNDRGSDFLIDLDLSAIDTQLPQAIRKKAEIWYKREYRVSARKFGSIALNFNGLGDLFMGKPVQLNRPAVPDVGAPDLVASAFLTEPDGWSSVSAGQTLTYTLGLENLATDAVANSVLLTANLPAGFSLVRTDPPATRLAEPGLPVWEIASLPATGLPEIYDVVAQISPGLAPGTVLTLTVQATSNAGDANPLDNSDQASGLQVLPSAPDLAVHSDLGEQELITSHPVTFTQSIVNQGGLSAAGTTFTLTLPPSVTLTSADPTSTSSGSNLASWNLGSIAPNAARQVTVTVSLDPLLDSPLALDPQIARSRYLTFTMEATTSADDYEPGNNAIQITKAVVSAGPDLMAALHLLSPDGQVDLFAGQDITYTIFYVNSGNQLAPSSTLTVSLGSGLNLLSASLPPDRSIASQSPVFGGGLLGWDLGDLPVGVDGTISLRVHVNFIPQFGTPVMAWISSKGFDIQPNDNLAFDQRNQGFLLLRELFLPGILR